MSFIYKHKQIVFLLVLISFLAVVFLGSTTMIHGLNESMQGECPFSFLGASFCTQSTLPAIFHHISSYQSFFNVPVNFDVTIFISFLLFAIFIIFMFLINDFLYKPLLYTQYTINSPPSIIHSKKLLYWLSLLENSPSPS